MMPPDPLPVEEKISQLLEEIRSLSAQRDGLVASGDGRRPSVAETRLSGEILRKFGLIDWILVLESRQPGPRTREESEALNKWKALVQTAKKELKATPEDVTAMHISSIPADTASRKNEDSRFHFYLDLPGPVVREEILSSLDRPQDKLNLLKAIPSEGPLMRWNEGSLQLQVLFPILMKRKVLDWKSIHTLSLLNSDVRDWITEYLEDSLPSDLWRYWPEFLDTSVERLAPLVQQDAGNRKEWSSLLNPSTQVDIKFRAAEAVDFARLRPILEPLGANIWKCCIIQGVEMPAVELLTRIKNLLTLTPNLRTLELVREEGQALVPVRNLEEQRRAMEQMEFPSLVSLKTLMFANFDQAPEFVLMARKMLNTYGTQLQHLYFTPPIPLPESGSFRLLSLKTLYISEIHAGVDGCLQFLPGFVDSPLKALSLCIPDQRHARSRLPHLLRFISTNFGDTLECLKLGLECVGIRDDRPRPLPPPSTTWMLDVCFPKLKNFIMDDFAQPGDFSFLLCFPKLVEFFFEEVDYPRDAIFEEETVLQMSLRRERICASNIWRIFPALRVYGLLGIGGGPVDWQQRQELYELMSRPVTRAECGAFQRRTV